MLGRHAEVEREDGNAVGREVLVDGGVGEAVVQHPRAAVHLDDERRGAFGLVEPTEKPFAVDFPVDEILYFQTRFRTSTGWRSMPTWRPACSKISRSFGAIAEE